MFGLSFSMDFMSLVLSKRSWVTVWLSVCQDIAGLSCCPLQADVMLDALRLPARPVRGVLYYTGFGVWCVIIYSCWCSVGWWSWCRWSDRQTAQSDNGKHLSIISLLHCESKKKLGHYTFVHNFDKCWPIVKILSLMCSPRNLQQNSQHVAHHTSDVSLHYLAKYKRTKLAKFYCI